MGEDVRSESLYLMEEFLDLHEAWFFTLEETARVVEGSNRREITLSEHSLDMASDLFDKVQQLLEQLVFDAELFTIGDYHVKIIEEYLEFFSYGLSDRKSTRLNSSHVAISYAVFCLKKKRKHNI